MYIRSSLSKSSVTKGCETILHTDKSFVGVSSSAVTEARRKFCDREDASAADQLSATKLLSVLASLQPFVRDENSRPWPRSVICRRHTVLSVLIDDLALNNRCLRRQTDKVVVGVVRFVKKIQNATRKLVAVGRLKNRRFGNRYSLTLDTRFAVATGGFRLHITRKPRIITNELSCVVDVHDNIRFERVGNNGSYSGRVCFGKIGVSRIS